MFPIWTGPEGVIPVATRWGVSPFTEDATTSAQWILSLTLFTVPERDVSSPLIVFNPVRPEYRRGFIY
jgi:hypothetical protein